MNEWDDRYDIDDPKWAHIFELCDRDTKEAKFHLIANVAIIVYLQSVLGFSLADIGLNKITLLIAPVAVGAVGGALAYALSHTRGRSLRYLLTGARSQVKKMKYFAQSSTVSLLIIGGFLLSTFALSVEIAVIVLVDIPSDRGSFARVLHEIGNWLGQR